VADGSGNRAERQSPAQAVPVTPVTGSTYIGTHVGGAYRPSFLQGLGIFSISLGAVLLLFLAGLLVADRALTNAARSQAEADASEVAALLENFIGTRALSLRGFRGLFLSNRPVADAQFAALIGEMASPATGLQRVWVADSAGRVVFDTLLLAGPAPSTSPGETAALIERARHARRAQLGRVQVTPGAAAGSGSVLMVEPLLVANRVEGFAGGVLLAS